MASGKKKKKLLTIRRPIEYIVGNNNYRIKNIQFISRRIVVVIIIENNGNGKELIVFSVGV